MKINHGELWVTIMEKRKVDSNPKRMCKARLESVPRDFSSFYLCFCFCLILVPRGSMWKPVRSLQLETQHNSRKAAGQSKQGG